jgi:hypothetical protein
MKEQLHTLIPISNGGYSWIDVEDLPRVRQYNWFKHRDKTMWYVQTNIKIGYRKYRTIGLHRFVLNTPHGKHTDHINGNTFDNRKSNLRPVNQAENAWNRKLMSIRLCPSGKWSVEMEVNGRKYYLGVFSCEEAAKDAYCQAAEWLRGSHWGKERV